MTVTLDVQEDKLDLFWAFVHQHQIEKAADDLKLAERAQIAVMLQQAEDPQLSKTETWVAVRARMLGA